MRQRPRSAGARARRDVTAVQIRAEVGPAVAAFTRRAGRPPGLGIVLVGDDPASEIYVRSKLKSAGEKGCAPISSRLPATASLARAARAGGAAESQRRARRHPRAVAAAGGDGRRRRAARLRRHRSRTRTWTAFHPINVGRLVQNRATLAACTPSGVIELLERSNIPIAGARAVVIGRSDIVGKPMALLLLHRHATVTICHSRTADLPRVAADADILVAAIGRPGFVTPEFVKPGATVVDVGTTQVTDRAIVERLFPAGSKRREAFERRGSIVVGDVHPDVAEVAGALTPVPGGVGPLTIAMLLKNTLTAALAAQ